MKNLPAFLHQLYSKIGGDTPYLHMTYKTLLAVFVALILWQILKRTLVSAEKRLKQYEVIRINEQIFLFARRGLYYALILGTGTYLIHLLNLPLLEKPFYAVLILLLAAPAKDFLIILIKYLEDNIADKTESKIDNIFFELLNRFAGALIYATAIVLALDMLGVNVMPFIAGAGVAGIAIGFAAKDTLSNLIAGVLLIVDRPFEIGDRIEVWNAPAGSATWGDVIDIGLRATRIKTTDNIVIIIPNNEIMTRDIVNYTAISSKIRVRVNIGISFDADIRKAKEIIADVADSADWIAKDPPPKVVVRNFGESSVDLQARVWIDDARKRMDTISYMTDHVKAAFDAEGIEIPYPRRDITITYRGDVSPDAPVRER